MPNIWNPIRTALCVCGQSFKGTLRDINRLVDAHIVDGCEGCDHTVCIIEEETK